MTTHVDAAQEESSLSDSAVHALCEIAYDHFTNGKYDLALSCYLYLLLQRPKDPMIWKFSGICHEAQKNYNDAIHSYSVSAVIQPDDPRTHWRAANCFYQQGNIEKALETLACAKECAKDSKDFQDMVEELENFENIWRERLQRN